MPREKLSSSEFIELAQSKNPDFEIIGEYRGPSSRIEIRCRKCGCEATRTASALLTRRVRCSTCRSLARARPDLLAEWDYERNDRIDPAKTMAGSMLKAWWKCPVCGRSYAAAIHNRVQGSGCPACAIAGAAKKRHETCVARSGSLAQACPLASEFWDRKSNGASTPEDVTPQCDKVAFWKCPSCNHAFSRTVREFGKRPGCPACRYGRKQRRPKSFRKSLMDASELDALFWDEEANGKAASETSWCSEKPAAWKCPECGYSWTQSPRGRVRACTGCPACGYKRKEKSRIADIARASRGREMTRGEIEEIDRIRRMKPGAPVAARLMLDAAFPDIAAEWDYEANAPLKPSAVYPTSTKKRSWICAKCGHRWLASVSSRTWNGTGCPRCAAEPRGFEKEARDE